MIRELDRHIKENEELALKTLQELIAIQSDQAPALTVNGETYPFGRGVQDAFVYTLKKAEEFGFETANIDNYGGHIDFPAKAPDGASGAKDAEGAKAPEVVGVIGHLDVVPAGDGWDFDPYCGEIKDGFVLGRGTTDNKGQLLASLFAMKALKEAGFEPDRTIRLIIGLDEETGWSGMDYYLEKVSAPTFGFTPDSRFPVINGEKGILHFNIAKKLSQSFSDGIRLRKLSAGTASNVVPDHARAVVLSDDPEHYEKIKDLAAAFSKEWGILHPEEHAKLDISSRAHVITVKIIGKSLEITASGKAAHASIPEEGVNAMAVLFDFLGRLDLASDDTMDFVDFFNSRIGYGTDGEGLGIKSGDDRVGYLSFCPSVVEYDGKAISVTCDVRFPVSITADGIYEAMTPHLDERSLGVVKIETKAPIFFDVESNLIKTLLDVYRRDTGDTESKAIVSGGGTYARIAPNIVAYGGLFPGDPDIMHQRNEKIAVERYLKMIEIYAHAIFELAQDSFTL